MPKIASLYFGFAVSAFALPALDHAHATDPAAGGAVVFAQASDTDGAGKKGGLQNRDPRAIDRGPGTTGRSRGAPATDLPGSGSTSTLPGSTVPGANPSMGPIPDRCARMSDTLARQQCIDRSRTK